MAQPTPDDRLVPWWRSFAFRFVALYTAVAIVVLTAGVIQLHHEQRREVVESFGRTLRSIAATIAPTIPARHLRDLRSNADVKRPGFRSVYAILDRVRRWNNLGRDRIYVLRPVPGKRDVYSFVVMLHDRPFVGDEYRPPAVLARLYRRVIRDKASIRTPLFTDKHGTFISGVAPVLDAGGRAVAMLHADLGVDRFLAAVARRTRMLVGGVAAVALLFLALGVLMHRRLRGAARTLMGGTEAIERELYDHVVALQTRDELGRVAEALNHALRKLGERFEMLKFIPEHTARMIEGALAGSGVNLRIARRVEVVVFESDIRGFTQLSERLSAEQIVALLNLYIRAQAELVHAAGGSIDKYMGDAVLAVFEGERKETRAIECALAIQRAIGEMNDARDRDAQPVRIGIGLTVGEVVMGNMGSERRMEHTIIGSTVNLAARLCSVAKADEIVLSDELYEAAQRDGAELTMLQSEQVTVKGFAEPVTCYRTALSCALPSPSGGSGDSGEGDDDDGGNGEGDD